MIKNDLMVKLISQPILMNKNILRNSQFLESLGKSIKGEAKAKVDKIIDLYKSRAISQRETAMNIIVKLKSTDKKEQQKAFKAYDKLIAKHGDKAPLSVRLVKNKSHIVNVLLYILPKQADGETSAEYTARKKKMRLYKGVYQQVAALSLNVTGSEQTLKDAHNKLVEHTQTVNNFDTEQLFRDLLELLRNQQRIKLISYCL